MTEAQIKYMVDRFLMWKLPEHFSPDAGISFTPTFNQHAPGGPQKHEPVGTNLFSADQATAMVRHMLDGMPSEFGQSFRDIKDTMGRKRRENLPDNAVVGATCFDQSSGKITMAPTKAELSRASEELREKYLNDGIWDWDRFHQETKDVASV